MNKAFPTKGSQVTFGQAASPNTYRKQGMFWTKPMVHLGTAEAWSWDMIFLAVSLVKKKISLGNVEEHQRVAEVSRHTGRLSSTVVHGMFASV